MILKIPRRLRDEHAPGLAKSNSQENTKLEKARPQWNTWILVLKIHIHPRQTSLATGKMLTKSRTKGKTTLILKDFLSKEGPSPVTIDR